MSRYAGVVDGRPVMFRLLALAFVATATISISSMGTTTRASGERATPIPAATLPPRVTASPSDGRTDTRSPEAGRSQGGSNGVSLAGPGATNSTPSLDGTAIAYDDTGSGPALLLLGDIGMAGDDWDPLLVDALSSGHRVIRMDYRGTGASGGDPAAAVSIGQLAEDGAAVLTALDIDADVVGYGMGGYVAQLLALDHPDAVRRLVLIGSDVGGSRTVVGEPGALEALAGHGTGQGSIEEAASWLFATDGRAAGEAALDRARMAEGCCRPVSIDAVDEQLAAIDAWRTEAPLAVRLFGMRQPTLVMHGADDRVVPAENGDALAATLPYATLRVFPDTGHGLPFEAGAAVVAEIAAFLDQQSSTPVALAAPLTVDDPDLVDRVAAWRDRSSLSDLDTDAWTGSPAAAPSGVLGCDDGIGAGCVGEEPVAVPSMHSYLGVLLGTYRENGMAVIVAGFEDAQGRRYTGSFRLGVDDGSPVEVRLADRPLPEEMGRFMVRSTAGLRRLEGLEGSPIALHVFVDTELLADDLEGAPSNASERLDRATDDLRRTERLRHASILAATEDRFVRADAPVGIDPAELGDVGPKALPVVTLVVVPDAT